jgi:putative heme transporter
MTTGTSTSGDGDRLGPRHRWWHLPHRRLAGSRRRRHHRGIEAAFVILGLVWLGWALSGSNRPSLRVEHPALLLLAVGLEFGSMASFARVQRIALATGGVPISVLQALRITYASNAVSVTVPVAGAAAATANTASEYRHQGADSGLIAWTLMITGIFSTVSFAAITATGAVLSGNLAAAVAGVAATLLGIFPIIGVLIAIRHPNSRARVINLVTAVLRFSFRVVRKPTQPTETADRLINDLASYHLGRIATLKVAFFASSNWLLDAACLGAAVAAFGEPVPWRSMFAIYAAGIGAAAIGFTPAGIGIVEAALASALATGGVASSRALPAALVYRAVSCWLVLGIGWFFFVRSRRHIADRHMHTE